MPSKYAFTSRIGGVDEALDDDVIDDGAAGVWWSRSGDELLIAVAAAALVFDEIVDEEDEDDGKICSALLPFSDAGPVWSSIMRLTSMMAERWWFAICNEFKEEEDCWKNGKIENRRVLVRTKFGCRIAN